MSSRTLQKEEVVEQARVIPDPIREITTPPLAVPRVTLCGDGGRVEPIGPYHLVIACGVETRTR